jgi:hypothetical protein
VVAFAQSNKPIINPPPTAKDWANLAKLPDWSGVWIPKPADQDRQAKTNMPPWTPAANEFININWLKKKREAHFLLTAYLKRCLPWMLVTHNAMEILFLYSRQSDSGRIGWQSPASNLYRWTTTSEDPDPTFHGHSIGKWEGNTLVVDTIGVVPQAFIAISEAAGVPNNGDMRIIERIHLAGKDELHDEIEIIAPKVLTKPWKTTRIYFRQRVKN